MVQNVIKSHDLVGILNGIDYTPLTDSKIG